MRRVLARRIAELDAEQPAFLAIDHGLDGPRADLAHFVLVISRVRIPSWPRDAGLLPRVTAVEADQALETCRLLRRLTDAVPELVTGPLRADAQLWVATTKVSYLPPRDLELSEAAFRELSDQALVQPSTKPFYVGLYTATAALGTYGMWHMNLDMEDAFRDPSRPWRIWRVEPSPRAVVQEIASASAWVDFVLAHPRHELGMIFPDWRSVARECDALHMTIRAIAATQGMLFSTKAGIVATTFWDVESTFWLRWCFDEVCLVKAGP